MKRTPLAVLAIVAAAACGSKKAAEPDPAVTPTASTREVARQVGGANAEPVADAGGVEPEAAVGPIPADSAQLVVLTTPQWDSPRATLRRFERRESDWSLVPGAEVPVMIGAAGLGWGLGLHSAEVPSGPTKREGDRRSPAGVFSIGDAYGYAPAAPDGSKLAYRQSTKSHLCIDDPKSKSYNRIVEAGAMAKDWTSAETMRRRDDLYRWVIEIDHNHLATNVDPAIGRGSCIFFHVWRRPDGPSVGCAMMSRPAIEQLMEWLDPGTHPIVVLLPEPVYTKVQGRWGLPPL